MTTVLFVDDSHTDLELFREGLEQRGINCITEHDPKEALLKIAEVNPDVVLLDVEMPDMNGFELCSNIKSNPLMEHIPVIFMSGTQDKNKLTTALHVGCVDFLEKPVALDVVANALKRHEIISKLHDAFNPLKLELAKLKAKYND